MEDAGDARAICRRCPVRRECGEMACKTKAAAGIHAGFFLPTERDDLSEFLGLEPQHWPMRTCRECKSEFRHRQARQWCQTCLNARLGDRVDGAPVREHVNELRSYDIGYGRIGAASGLGKSTIARIMGERHTGPVPREYAEALLALRISDFESVTG
ncbi:WhiB family transcriptional regulator [Nocardia sp. NPDC003999]